MLATPARLAIGVFAALAALSPAPVSAATASVNVGDSFFDPETTVIEAGSSVVWTQTGNAPHSVTADDGTFDSHPACLSVPGGCMGNGDTYTRAFDEPGIFPYYCKVHSSPGGSGMNGVVRVVDETGVTPTVITRLDATPAAGSVSVSGDAIFGGQKLLSLGTDPAGDSFGGLKEADLVEAKMGQLDPATGDLTFVFKLADLPLNGGVPEALDYLWGFRLAPLHAVFRIQTSYAKVGVLSPRPWAQIYTCPTGPEGECRVAALPTPEYVGSNNEIIVDIPKSLLETRIGRRLAGLRVGPGPEGWAELIASPPWPLGGADILAPEDEYEIAFQRVDVGIAAPGTEPTTMTSGTVGSDGSFSSSLDTAGFAPGPYDVVTRACYGTNCGSSRTRILI